MEIYRFSDCITDKDSKAILSCNPGTFVNIPKNKASLFDVISVAYRWEKFGRIQARIDKEALKRYFLELS